MLNRIAVQGRFTRDIELRTTPSGLSVCSFTVATDDGYGDKQKTYFLNCIAWRKTAELICKYCNKGDMVIVEGKLTSRNYTDKNSNKRTAFEIVADNVHFAEPKRDGATVGSAYHAAEKAPDVSAGKDDFEEIPSDDDLPFD